MPLKGGSIDVWVCNTNTAAPPHQTGGERDGRGKMCATANTKIGTANYEHFDRPLHAQCWLYRMKRTKITTLNRRHRTHTLNFAENPLRMRAHAHTRAHNVSLEADIVWSSAFRIPQYAIQYQHQILVSDNYEVCGTDYLLTYLLHGAESFLRS